MRGAGYVSATVGQYSVVGLLNDSSGAEMLAVRGITVPGENTSDAVGMYFTRFDSTYLMGANQTLGAVVTGEPPRAGKIVQNSSTSRPALDFYLPGSTGNYPASLWPSFPIAVLQPGWILNISSQDTNVWIFVGFMWEAVHIEDLMPGLRCPTCDVLVVPG